MRKQESGCAENPEPFEILKNVRKYSSHSHRKNSRNMNPTPMKKTRKMTAQIFQQRQMQEELNLSMQAKSLPQIDILEQEIEKQQRGYEQHGGGNEDMGGNEDIVKNDPDLENSIPFKVNEWELDKESPYLKYSSEMDIEQGELN